MDMQVIAVAGGLVAAVAFLVHITRVHFEQELTAVSNQWLRRPARPPRRLGPDRARGDARRPASHRRANR